MGFKIDIFNAGPDGTIEVIEVVNENETATVFSDVMDSGSTKVGVDCIGTGVKTFKWTHLGNGHVGHADKADGEKLTIDPPG